MPVPPAEHGGEHDVLRMTVAVQGSREDAHNRATSTYLTSVPHRYAIAKGRLERSGDRVVHVYLPTLRDAVDLMRACPHLRLAADRYDSEPLR